MSEFRLTVAASDKTAEITVLDARQNPVLTGLGCVDATLPAGLYELRTRLGPATQEKVVALAGDRTVPISEDDLRFPTPVPLSNTARTRDYHERAAIDASSMTPIDHGAGATILVFARDWSPDETTTGNPLLGLALHDAAGTRLLDLLEGADYRQKGDVSAGNRVSVDPGAYRLRLTAADGATSERMVIAVAGWQTQSFMFRQDRDGDRRADLAGGAIVMSREDRGPGRMFDPSGKGERVAVLARYALVQRRPIAEAVYKELFDLKFDDPILGLLAAHLLLRDEPGRRDLLDEVLAKLRSILGPDHPDVLALNLRAANSMPADTVLRTPPMLRASWDALTAASVARPALIPDDDLFDSLQRAIDPSLPWLTWQLNAGAGLDRTSSGSHRMEALKAFLVAKGSLATASRSIDGGGAGLPETSASVIAAAASRGSASGSGSGETEAPGLGAPSTKPEAAGSLPLGDAVKVELTRSLGVSGARLEGMLKSVWDDASSGQVKRRDDGR